MGVMDLELLNFLRSTVGKRLVIFGDLVEIQTESDDEETSKDKITISSKQIDNE